MQMRTSKPGAGNKFFITTGAGGYSRCIVGKPTDSQCNVLSNCVGYACGRFNEIIGSMKYPYLNCNAENFIERAKSAGLQVVNYPTLGGIMVWQKGNTLSGNDGAGHVAVVERIDSANQIYTSESGYGGSAFWNSIRKNTNRRWGMGSGYSFRGCIVNPAIGDVHYVETSKPSNTTTTNYITYTVVKGDTLSNIAKKYNTTWQKIYADNKSVIGSNPNIIRAGQKIKIVSDTSTSSITYKVGNQVTINGVYISSTSIKKLKPAVTKGKITKIIPSARNPYLLNDGKIGWVNDECIVNNTIN